MGGVRAPPFFVRDWVGRWWCKACYRICWNILANQISRR